MAFVKRILRYRNRTVLLSVGSLIPKDWNFVVVRILEQNDKEIILKLTRVNSALEKALMESGLRVENTS
jgi:hypothetical protein